MYYFIPTNNEFKKIYNKMKSHDDMICRYCNQAMPEQELEDRRNIAKNTLIK